MFLDLLIATFRKISRKILSNFGVESVEPSMEQAPELLWGHESSTTTDFAQFAATTILMCGIGWFIFFGEQAIPIHFIALLLILPILLLVPLKPSHKVVSGYLLFYLYLIGTALLVIQGATGQPRLFFFAVMMIGYGGFGIRVGIGVSLLSLVTFTLFACGFPSFPLSPSCITQSAPLTLTSQAGNFGIMIAVALGGYHSGSLREKKRLRYEQRLAAELSQKSDELASVLVREQEINQIQGDLLNAVSYEFFTPMSVIKMSSKMMMKKHERGHLTTEQSQAYHAEIEENVGRLSELINIVMTSRPQTNDELNTLTEQIKGEIWTT